MQATLSGWTEIETSAPESETRPTITADTHPVAAVCHAIAGGRFRVRLTDDNGPGRRYGVVLDDAGNRIGDASDYIYGGRGFAIHTAPFGGFVPVDQIEFVPAEAAALAVGDLVWAETALSRGMGRESRIAEITKTASGRTTYVLRDGGMFSANELRPIR